MPVVTTAEYMADVVPEDTDRTCPDVARPEARAAEILSDVSYRTTTRRSRAHEGVPHRVEGRQAGGGRGAGARVRAEGAGRGGRDAVVPGVPGPRTPRLPAVR